jgi:hypothetical protein
MHASKSKDPHAALRCAGWICRRALSLHPSIHPASQPVFLLLRHRWFCYPLLSCAVLRCAALYMSPPLIPRHTTPYQQSTIPPSARNVPRRSRLHLHIHTHAYTHTHARTRMRMRRRAMQPYPTRHRVGVRKASVIGVGIGVDIGRGVGKRAEMDVEVSGRGCGLLYWSIASVWDCADWGGLGFRVWKCAVCFVLCSVAIPAPAVGGEVMGCDTMQIRIYLHPNPIHLSTSRSVECVYPACRCVSLCVALA